MIIPLGDAKPSCSAIFCFAWVILGSLVASCTDVRKQFLGDRVLDACNSQWKVCDDTVGCIIGDRSYISGKFPGKNQFGIRLFEPSTVTLSLYLEASAATGEETTISFHEERCRAMKQVTLTGKELLAESDKVGFVEREAELTGEGDHLIEIDSDARTDYLLKVEIVPTLLKPM